MRIPDSFADKIYELIVDTIDDYVAHSKEELQYEDYDAIIRPLVEEAWLPQDTRAALELLQRNSDVLAWLDTINITDYTDSDAMTFVSVLNAALWFALDEAYVTVREDAWRAYERDVASGKIR